MANQTYFNGNIITVPGAYSAIDTSGIATKSELSGLKTLAILGECTGGEPGAVQFFTDTVSARKILKSGELLKACEKAWNPVTSTKEGVDIGGANIIACIRTNKATKSSIKIFKDFSATLPQLVFQSKDWGKNTNYQIKIQDSESEGTKKITIYDQVNNYYENFDELGKLFSIAYIGTEPYAELNIFRDATGVFHFQTRIGENMEDAEEDISIVLDNNVYKSMRALIYELQSYENYKIAVPNRYNTRIKVSEFDLVVNKNIKAPDENTLFNVTAVYADIYYNLSVSSNLIELYSFDRSQGEIDNIDNYVALTGGTEGVSPFSWVEFFDQLSGFDIDYIVPLTDDKSIHAELSEHINICSGTMGRERRGVVGGAISETVNETLQRAHELNSSRIQVVHGGFYDVNTNGELELYPPYILAAQHAGRAVFLPEGESATHDVYRMSAPEYQLEAGEITKLLQGGCLAFEYVLSGNSATASYVRLVRDITTDLINTDSVHVERATGQLADSLNKEIRKKLDKMLTGKRMTGTTIVSAQNAILSILQNRMRDGYITGYKNVSVTNSNGITEVHYGVAAAEPNNFTLITAHYYSQELSA